VVYDELGPLVAALAARAIVALPTDTVYGLACSAGDRDACERLLLGKGRDPAKPSAIAVGSVDALLGVVLPALPGAVAARVRSLLPGPLTLVVPNAGASFPWLCGDTSDRIGVRVPDLDPRLAAAIDLAGPLLLTSANAAGEPAATTFAGLAPIAGLATVALDGGACPGGIASTVVDVTASEPRLVRPGPVSLEAVRARLGLA
jgi:tRNA threonylcarbamoyl adenosine modification protein (Sua5/YciO/YrdC/YwlC family)